MTDDYFKCVCGEPKNPHDIVCTGCFHELPVSVRNSIKTAATREQREHIQRQILQGITNLVRRRQNKAYGI